MNLVHELDNRDVIPVWRSFSTTLELGELSQLNLAPKPNFDLSDLKADWRNLKTIGTAADLVNAHYISNNEIDDEILDAIQYINSFSKTSELLKGLAGKLYNNIGNESLSEVNESLDNPFLLISQLKYIIENGARIQINYYKKLCIIDPKNPINWVELSRLYSIEGNKEKAEKAIINALYLAPDNRYVLRSATRLFIEINKPDVALHYLRKSNITQIDPWLTSAHIAVSSFSERYSPFIKNALRQRESSKFTSFDLTELNSSLGTLELSNGSFKKAKPFFNDSLKLPNDNSLAQFQFMLNHDKRLYNLIPLNTNVKNNYEALSLKYRDAGEWKKALENSLKWFIDVPYSIDPAIQSSYILCTVLGDFETAVTICKLSLKTNSSDVTILNNLCYALLQLNRLGEAKKFLEVMDFYSKIKKNTITKESAITMLATNALYLLKIGNIEQGIDMYNEAINLAQKGNAKYYVLAGQLILAKELNGINHSTSEQLIKIALNLKLDEYKDLEEYRKLNFSIKHV